MSDAVKITCKKCGCEIVIHSDMIQKIKLCSRCAEAETPVATYTKNKNAGV
jgi:hypothetical protein